MSEFDPYYDVRAKLVDALARDLAGPAPEDRNAETIEDPPLTQYIVGVLYPQSGDPIDPTQDVDIADDYDEIAVPDPPVAMANVRYPASMGMTFSVDPDVAQGSRCVSRHRDTSCWRRMSKTSPTSPRARVGAVPVR